MANFQGIVIVIAIILLILCLIFIGITLVKTKNDSQWPPIVGDCPDYWVDMSGNGTNCVNVRKLGRCTTGEHSSMDMMNFSVSPYIGSAGMCSKYKWANKCGVTWDGITSGIANPCTELTNSK